MLPYGRSDTDVSGREVGRSGISLSVALPGQQDQQTPHPLRLVPLRTSLPEPPAVAPTSCVLAPSQDGCLLCRLAGPGSARGSAAVCGRPVAQSLPLGATLPAEAEIHLGVLTAVCSWGQRQLTSL